MINLMFKFAYLITILLFANTNSVNATKLNAQPLPSEKDFNSAQEVSVPNSKFKRRPDYRQAEQDAKEQAKLKAEQDAQNKLNAQKAQQKAYNDRINAYKKQLAQAKEYNTQALSCGKSGQYLEAIELHEKACKYDMTNKQYKINLSAIRTVYAQKLIAAKNYNAAIPQLRKALYVAPDNALSESLLNQCLSKLGFEPQDGATRVKLGDKLIADGNNEEGYVEYQQSVKLGYAEGCVKIGDIYFRARQYPQAQSWYTQALAKDSKNSDAYRNLAMMYLYAKDNGNAASYLRKALIYNQNDVLAQNTLIDLWRKQVALNPNNCDFIVGLAGAYQLSKNYDEAKAQYAKAYQIEPNNTNLQLGVKSLNCAMQEEQAAKYKLAAQSLYDQGLYKEAIAQMSQAVALRPKNSHYQLLLGQCFEALGDFQSAHRAYLASVLADPEHSATAAQRLKNMEENKKSAQDTSDSIGSSQQAFDSHNTKNQYEESNDLANGKNPIANDSNNNDNNIEGLKKELENNMQSAKLHFKLAKALKNNGQIEEAIAEFRIASALDSKNDSYTQELAKTLKEYRQEKAGK